MRIFGITGGTGCGKTTALNCLAERGAYLIDCDAVYHGLLETDTAMLEALDRAFPGVVTAEGLDRKALGARVFAHKEALDRLNQTIKGPVLAAIRRELDRARESGAPIAAIDAINLMESGLGDLCDVTIAVTAPTEDRVRRLMAREGVSEDYARLRIAAQKPNAYYEALCARTLVNDCPTPEAFGRVCDALFDTLLN